tara:strand:+ start:442 stop:855 length:414 start_codon:yes stop_codon:yes gene_type:complete
MAKKVLVINEIKIPVNVIQIAEDTKKENSLFKKYEMTTHDIIEPNIIATKPAKLPIITDRNRIDNNIIFFEAPSVFKIEDSKILFCSEVESAPIMTKKPKNIISAAHHLIINEDFKIISFTFLTVSPTDTDVTLGNF